MRILHVISTFPPAFAFGGPPKVAFDVCKELVKRGHSVKVYTTNADDQRSNFKPKSKTVIISGVEVTYFNNVLRIGKLFIAPRMIIEMQKTHRDFDVIHIHFGRQPYDVFIGLTSDVFKVPYVIQAHGGLSKIGKMKRFKIIFDAIFGKKILRKAAKAIALNTMEAKEYKNMGVPEEKIVIIPNGIDLSEYANLPPKGSFKRKFNIPDDKKIILYLGRIHKTKGIDLLITAYAYLVKKMNYKDAVLVIAGPDDGYLDEVKTLARSLDVLKLITFTGFISKEDKLKAFVDAEVFVTPVFYGFPLTFLEACVAGTPIVTTNLGDILEWIVGKVGYVAQPTPQALAEAIYKIISDNELHRKFSRNCIEIVKSEFSIEKVVNRLEKVYKEVVEGGS